MKSFLNRYYHWVLLGLAVAVLLLSLAILTPRLLNFRESFSRSSTSTPKAAEGTVRQAPNATAALELLKKKDPWKSREDGASPLVSRPYLLKEGGLVDPSEGSTPLYPPVPNRWLIEHQIDYTDTKILERDAGHKGFTVLEEFLAGTDPNDPRQLPPLCTKLTYSDADIHRGDYTMEFLGIADEESGDITHYQLRPLKPLPNPERNNRPDTATRRVAVGEPVPGAPFLKVAEHRPLTKTVNDTPYDVSELVLVNTLTGERHTLARKNLSRGYAPHPLSVMESVAFHYRLTGVPEQVIAVNRGEGFTLGSLDKTYQETYKLVDFSSEGILLEKGGEKYSVKKAGASPSAKTP